MKIGFLISHYGENELAKYFISSANNFLLNNTDVDIIGFVNNHVKPVSHPSFGTMNINEAFDFNGIIIATTLFTAAKCIKFPGPIRRYFYLWDLEWAKDKRYTFEDLFDIYHNPKISLIGRNEHDAKIIEQCWNRPVRAVIPDCDVKAFVEMVRTDGKKQSIL